MDIHQLHDDLARDRLHLLRHGIVELYANVIETYTSFWAMQFYRNLLSVVIDNGLTYKIGCTYSHALLTGPFLLQHEPKTHLANSLCPALLEETGSWTVNANGVGLASIPTACNVVSAGMRKHLLQTRRHRLNIHLWIIRRCSNEL